MFHICNAKLDDYQCGSNDLPIGLTLTEKFVLLVISLFWAQAESTVHMLNWAIRSVKFLGVEFD